MKLSHSIRFLRPLLFGVIAATLVSNVLAAPRHRPGNPRGVADPRGRLDPRGALDPRGIADPRGIRDPRGVMDPRGVLDPRGIADPRGLFDPRGPFDPRNPMRYMYRLPTGYAMRAFAGVNFYYCAGTYYYPYYINGETVYVKTTIRDGVPIVPPRPY